MDNTQVANLHVRLKHTQEGLDYIEYLKTQLANTYEEFTRCDPDLNNIVKGKAIAYVSLIKEFEKSSDKIVQNADLETHAY